VNLQEVERQQGKVEKLQSAQSTLSAKYEMVSGWYVCDYGDVCELVSEKAIVCQI
jgi:hypothetical protein